jgi:hypothetical protein
MDHRRLVEVAALEHEEISTIRGVKNISTIE